MRLCALGVLHSHLSGMVVPGERIDESEQNTAKNKQHV
jgi:hypothetical protein